MKITSKMRICIPIIGLMSLLTLGQDHIAALDTIFLSEQDPTGPGKVVLVAKNGNIIYKKATGKANLELDINMETDFVFRIGSISKQFTAFAILKLAEEGRLSLQDEISKYISDYPVHGHTITLEHLLTHTSGITNYTNLPKFDGNARRKDLSPKELIDFFKDEPMDFVPGEKHQYSNSGYILLGYVIEQVSGMGYAEYLREKFFEPLNMQNTSYDLTPKLVNNRIPGYQYRRGGYENSDYLSMTLPYAAGSLLSTTEDLFIWNKAVMNDLLLSKESRYMAHSAYMLKSGNKVDYGLGWRLGNVQGKPSINHGGLVNGFTSYATYLPDEQIFVVVLSNCDCTQSLNVLASKMAATVMGSPYNFKKIKMSPKRLRAFQGIYRSENGEERTIRYEDGRLLHFNKGGQKSQLQPLEKNKFQLNESLIRLEFEKGPSGKAQGFVMKSLNSPTNWLKTNDRITSFESISLPLDVLDRYLGEYRLSKGRIFKVVMEGKKLFGQMGGNREEIIPLNRERFFAKNIDALLLFDFDEEDTVKGLTIVQGKPRKALKIK
ncbi:serine hydrolase domain-containing protein [Flagellimonas algicola]|uniref:Serine hydrolase n=1 Tax=Flagellimonas algicola TaxID=2583815 RepID=A0ABY2WRJ0_9FLAO|nr:serine hydrolase domain-containing protein [Allomuricauda algicola]TMU57355.1 serine hydrolase [Allomuricauda algicola]